MSLSSILSWADTEIQKVSGYNAVFQHMPDITTLDEAVTLAGTGNNDGAGFEIIKFWQMRLTGRPTEADAETDPLGRATFAGAGYDTYRMRYQCIWRLHSGGQSQKDHALHAVEVADELSDESAPSSITNVYLVRPAQITALEEFRWLSKAVWHGATVEQEILVDRQVYG